MLREHFPHVVGAPQHFTAQPCRKDLQPHIARCSRTGSSGAPEPARNRQRSLLIIFSILIVAFRCHRVAFNFFLFDRRVRWPYKVRYIPPGFQLELKAAGPHQVWLCERAPRHALLKFRADVHEPHVSKGLTFG